VKFIFVHTVCTVCATNIFKKSQSVLRLATGRTVRGSNLGGGEIFRTCQDRLWEQPSLLYNGYRVFIGGKAAGAWRYPLTPSTLPLDLRGLV